jgi:hypothetical protein
MILAVNAWKWRTAARNALGSGEFERAFELAAKAQEAQGTAEGEALLVVARVAALN